MSAPDGRLAAAISRRSTNASYPRTALVPAAARGRRWSGPGGVQAWAGDVIAVLRAACARGDTALDHKALDDLRERYDTAVRHGITHNRLRDWDTGNHPGYALACWLRDYREQVSLFTREFAVDWTNNVSERGAKAAKRHQAVSGYWHSLTTLARWCRLRSYHCTRRHQRRHRRQTLAAATTRNQLTPAIGTL
jgi:transposase